MGMRLVGSVLLAEGVTPPHPKQGAWPTDRLTAGSEFVITIKEGVRELILTAFKTLSGTTTNIFLYRIFSRKHISVFTALAADFLFIDEKKQT